jgi:hypothetical protein
MPPNTDVQAILADAEGWAHDNLTAAGNAADSFLTAAASGVGTTVQKIETDALTTLIDFIPSSYRAPAQAALTPFVTGAETTLNAAISADVAKGLAIAKARINAVTGATG